MHVVLKSLLLFFLSLGGVEMNSAINAQLAKLSLQMSVLSLSISYILWGRHLWKIGNLTQWSLFPSFWFFFCLFIYSFIHLRANHTLFLSDYFHLWFSVQSQSFPTFRYLKNIQGNKYLKYFSRLSTEKWILLMYCNMRIHTKCVCHKVGKKVGTMHLCICIHPHA